jgi:hypothetical protein
MTDQTNSSARTLAIVGVSAGVLVLGIAIWPAIKGLSATVGVASNIVNRVLGWGDKALGGVGDALSWGVGTASSIGSSAVGALKTGVGWINPFD